jgi:site-specific recombinase XerD
MEALIAPFRTWLIANSRAKNTVLAYIAHIQAFFNKTGIKDVSEINSKLINEYIASMKGTSSQQTCNNHISAIKSLLDFKDILIRVPKTKRPTRKVVKFVSEEEFNNIILPMVDREFLEPLKTKAVLSFLYYAGLRKEDVALVKRNQINLDENYATVYITKQNIEKNILIPIRLIDILRKYFISEAEDFNAFNMTSGAIQHIFTKLRWMLPELHLHPHKFRKSYATNAYKMGMTLEQVQKMMGHKDIATTQIYVQEADEEELRKQYLQLEKEKIKQLIKKSKIKKENIC